MNNGRSNTNLMEELEGRQMALATMNMPNGYKNMYRAQIAALKQELARRWRTAAVARNEPRRQARAAKVIQKKFKNVFYTPNNNGMGLRGRGYRMAMARVRGNNSARVGPRERITGMLRTKLENLRHARNTGNRGNMVNIYNSMSRKWEGSGGIHGANVMNNAQKIMFRAGLIM